MGTIPALQPFQAPQNQVNLGDTYVQMARMKAYQQQARLDELRLGQEQRREDRGRLWEQYMSEVYTPQTPPEGLAAPQPSGQPQAPQGGLAMAQAGPQAQMPQGPPQGYAGPPSLAAAAPSYDAPLPPQGAQQGGYPGMPPEINALAPPVDTSQPPMANVGIRQAQAQPPPQPPSPGPGLAQAQGPPPQAPAPPQAAPGGLGQGSGTKPVFQGLLKPLNEEALIRAHRTDPERTEKWFTGMMKMQGDKIKQTKEMNGLVYETLKAVDRSPNPAAMWPEAIRSLREKGIPVPKELETFDPAMLKFKLNEHRTADVEAKEAEAKWKEQQAHTEKMLGLKHEADTAEKRQQTAMAPEAQDVWRRGQEEDIRGKQQTRDIAAEAERHNAIMRPLQEKELGIKNRRETILADTALTEEQRKEKLFQIEQEQRQVDLERAKAGVPQYLKDDADTNTALNQVMKQRYGDAAAGKSPEAKDIQDARRLVIQGKIDVAAAHQRDAGKSAALKGVLEGAVAKGQAAEDVHSVLDDMEDLIRRGTLSSTPGEAWRVYAQKLGLRPTDAESARTQVLKSLGDQLTLAKSGGTLGRITDADRDLIARATGGFGKLMSPAEQKEALIQLRRSSDRDLEHGNRVLKQHAETGTVPEFGQVRKERQARTIDHAKFEQLLAAKQAQNPSWTRENFIKALESSKTADGKDYILRID